MDEDIFSGFLQRYFGGHLFIKQLREAYKTIFENQEVINLFRTKSAISVKFKNIYG